MKAIGYILLTVALLIIIAIGVNNRLMLIKMDENLGKISALENKFADLKKVVEAQMKRGDRQRPPEQKRRTPPKEARVSMDDEPILGNVNAPLTMIEFSDYQCPFCSRHTTRTFPQIKKEYIDTGKLRYVFRDYPLKFHRNAEEAAEATECAEEQGKFWEMHHTIFENQKALQFENLKKYAADLGLDPEKFQECMDSDRYVNEVKKDLSDGLEAGVKGTPAFFIGKSEDGKEIKGSFVSGARPYDDFKEKIEELLEK